MTDDEIKRIREITEQYCDDLNFIDILFSELNTLKARSKNIEEEQIRFGDYLAEDLGHSVSPEYLQKVMKDYKDPV